MDSTDRMFAKVEASARLGGAADAMTEAALKKAKESSS